MSPRWAGVAGRTLETGETKVIDLEPLMQGPIFEPLIKDYELFTQVRIDP